MKTILANARLYVPYVCGNWKAIGQRVGAASVRLRVSLSLAVRRKAA